MSFSDKNWTSGGITVPDGVTSLGAIAVVMSENLGLSFTPVPQKVLKPLYLPLLVPGCIPVLFPNYFCLCLLSWH